MKKFILLAGASLALLFPAFSQKNELLLKSNDKGLYVEHKVVSKESFYSVGRMYNVHPRSIASFNKLDMAKGLLIDQKLRIPLTDTNFTQAQNSGAPVYLKSDDDQELEKLSKDAANASLDKIRMWNNLSNNRVTKGQKLIVGFLTGSQLPSVTIAEKKAPVGVPADEKIERQPVVISKEEPKEEVKEKKATEPPVEEKPKVEIKPATDAGFFKSFFEKQLRVSPVTKNETVTAGIFKTTSGWQDAKYYLLIDKVQPGTIVKVINPENNKAVYAKVLGEMAGIRQNQGLDIRISNAAAAALSVTEQDKFIVKVAY